MVLKFISFLVYLTILNNNYLLFNDNNLKTKPAFINNTYSKFNPVNNTKNIDNSSNHKYLRRRSKFCHFKCDCFFSHNVKNDNICVTNWIKPIGL